MLTPTDTVLEFIDAINSQNIDKLVGMLTPDHKFTDALGTVIDGRRHVRDAWLGYFKIVPDYRINVDETFYNEASAVAVGTATGTFSRDGQLLPENKWKIPAAWRGAVDGGRLSAWYAYVDHDPLRKAMSR